MSEHVSVACDAVGCGQVDDHPKVHYGTSTYHHDCLPAGVEAVLVGHAPAIVAAAKSGVRGAELREFIQRTHGEGA